MLITINEKMSEREGPAKEFFLEKKSNGKNEKEKVRDREDRWKGDPFIVVPKQSREELAKIGEAGKNPKKDTKLFRTKILQLLDKINEKGQQRKNRYLLFLELFLTQGIEPTSPTLQVDSLPMSYQRSPIKHLK